MARARPVPAAAGRATVTRRARRRPRWPRVLLVLGLVLFLAAVGGVAGLRLLTNRYDRSVTKEPLLDPGARQDRTVVSGALNYLVVGSDRRAAATPGNERSDTIMIVHVPADRKQAYLISVPRDLYVAIPPAPNGGYPGGHDKINAAFGYGGGGQSGTRLLSATLSQLTGLKFDGAALVDFSGFQQVIDLLGGVRMCVDAPVKSIHTGARFEVGCRRMSGAEALDYVRQRYGLPGGDYDRQRHQQQLLRAIMDRAAETKLINDPVRLDRVLRAVGSSFTVDTNGVPLQELLVALHGLRSDALVGLQVPSHPQTVNRISYVLLDLGAGGLFTALRSEAVENWTRGNARWVNRR